MNKMGADILANAIAAAMTAAMGCAAGYGARAMVNYFDKDNKKKDDDNVVPIRGSVPNSGSQNF